MTHKSIIKNIKNLVLVLCLMLGTIAPLKAVAAVVTPKPDGGGNAAGVGAGSNGSTAVTPQGCTSYSVKCASCEASANSQVNDCVKCIDQKTPLTAGQVSCSDTTSACSIDKCDLLNKYVNPFIRLLTASVGVIVVISIIYGAIQYSASGGDPQKAAKARGHITKTVLALIAYIFFYAFLQFLIPGGILNR